MFPTKLKQGDEIRIIAPSQSLSTIDSETCNRAIKLLSKQFKITFSKHCSEIDADGSSSIQSRASDLWEAFYDKNVKAILACTGGYNVNQILEYIDYSVISKNPKIICGFSDITALINAIHAKTGLVTYHGADFITIGAAEDSIYTMEYFNKCLVNQQPYLIKPYQESDSYIPVQVGEAIGQIIGGNICTLNLLQGTEYMPNLNDKILFLEDMNTVGETFLKEFDRDLESLLQLKCLVRIKGLVFGKFDKSCNMTIEAIKRMISTKRKLQDIPIAFNVDFGHIHQMATFPVGGRAKLSVTTDKVDILILEH